MRHSMVMVATVVMEAIVEGMATVATGQAAITMGDIGLMAVTGAGSEQLQGCVQRGVFAAEASHS